MCADTTYRFRWNGNPTRRSISSGRREAARLCPCATSASCHVCVVCRVSCVVCRVSCVVLRLRCIRPAPRTCCPSRYAALRHVSAAPNHGLGSAASPTLDLPVSIPRSKMKTSTSWPSSAALQRNARRSRRSIRRSASPTRAAGSTARSATPGRLPPRTVISRPMPPVTALAPNAMTCWRRPRSSLAAGHSRWTCARAHRG